MVPKNIEMEGETVDFFPDIDLKIVSRDKWEALPPKSTESLPLPAQRCFFMFTDTERCVTKKECIKALQGLQRHYMDLGMPDLPFSFLIGGDLRIYEGRGWGVKISRTDVREWHDERVVIGYICPQKLADDRTNNMFRKGYQIMYHGIENNYIVDFDKYGKHHLNVEDDKEVLKKYNEEVAKKEEKEKWRRDRMEEKRKAREEKARQAPVNGSQNKSEEEPPTEGDMNLKMEQVEL